MKLELLDNRIDATGFSNEAQARAELADKTRVPLQGGLVAVIVKPWEIKTSTFNPHGYGVPANRVYAVARFVVVPEADQYDCGKVLLEYRRKLREAMARRVFESDKEFFRAEIKRIEPRLFGLGLGFEK